MDFLTDLLVLKILVSLSKKKKLDLMTNEPKTWTKFSLWLVIEQVDFAFSDVFLFTLILIYCSKMIGRFHFGIYPRADHAVSVSSIVFGH